VPGTNVGGSYIHPCADSVNARRPDVSLGTAIKDDVFKVKKSFRNRERHWLSDDGVGSTTIGKAKYGGNKLGDF
jgi:hypothetical protein